ncbi:MAG TPA: hypothetical protein V6D10_21170 [Trichocoleus sp.]
MSALDIHLADPPRTIETFNNSTGTQTEDQQQPRSGCSTFCCNQL